MIQRFFTSDLHLGHENILQSRPEFQNIDEMDECLIQNWNKKVNVQDEVYILGDFSFRAKKICDIHSIFVDIIPSQRPVTVETLPWDEETTSKTPYCCSTPFAQ